MRDYHEVATSQVEVCKTVRQEISALAESGQPGSSIIATLRVELTNGRVDRVVFCGDPMVNIIGPQGESVPRGKIIMRLRRVGKLFMVVADALQALT